MSRKRTLKERQEDIRTLTRVPSEFIHAKLDELAEEVGELANQGWIPCSERLPEDGQTVLAYIGGRHNSCNYLCACHTVEEYTDRWRNARTGFAILCEVIAWMPLPELYKEDN